MTFADFGSGYGASPGIIYQGGAQKAPYFLAASREGIKRVNLVTGKVTEHVRLVSGEEILSSLQENYATVAAEDDTFFFLVRRGGKVFLTAGNFDGGIVASYELPRADRTVGPMKMGKSVAAYSHESIYVLEETVS